MKITIESTSRIVQLARRAGETTVVARVWEGTTESGIKVQALVTRIGAMTTDDLSQFEAELQGTRQPTPDVDMFPLRMIL